MTLKSNKRLLLLGMSFLFYSHASSAITIPFTNPRNNQTFIQDLYLKYVGYAPDVEGMAYYLSILKTPGNEERVEMLISDSLEAKEYFVSKCFLTDTGHEANAVELVYFSSLLISPRDREPVRKIISLTTEAKIYFIQQIYIQNTGIICDVRGLAYYLRMITSEEDFAIVKHLISTSPEAGKHNPTQGDPS